MRLRGSIRAFKNAAVFGPLDAIAQIQSAVDHKEPLRTDGEPDTKQTEPSAPPARRCPCFCPPPGNERADQLPPIGSFSVAVFYCVLSVTQFVIVLPTSTAYMEAFGVPKELVGVLVGLTPFGAGLVQPFLVPLFNRVKLKTILLLWCVISSVGNTMYALGLLSGTVAVPIVARFIMGSATGLTIVSTYVVRTTGVKARTVVMQWVGLGIGIGYSAGPLLGVAVEAVCNAAGWIYPPVSNPHLANSSSTNATVDTKYIVLNGATTVGWLMLILFGIEFCLVLAFFKEPPNPKGPPADAEGAPAPPPLPLGRILCAMVPVYLIPMNVGSWEVNTVFTGTSIWRWTTIYTGLYLGLLQLVVVPLLLIPVTHWLSDRAGMLISCAEIIIVHHLRD